MAYTLEDVAEEAQPKPAAPAGYSLDDVADAPEVSKWKSGALGASQGASMGWGDEGSALIVALAKKMTGRGQGTFEENYVKARDALRAKIDEAKEANPKTYLAGEIGGGMATAPLAGEGNLARLAALGAIQGLGNSEADLTKGDVGGAVRDTTIGGTIGAAMKPVGWAVGKAASGLKNMIDPAWLEELAQSRAAKALGYSKGMLKKPGAIPRSREVGQEMLDNGVIKWNSSAEDMASGASDLVENKGKEIGDFLRGRTPSFETADMVAALNKVRPMNSEGQWLRGGQYDKINKLIDEAIDTARAHGDMIPFEEANKLKGMLQNVVNWQSTNVEQETGRKIAGAARESIDTTLENRAKSVADPHMTFRDEYSSPQEAMERVEEFFANKKTYGAAQEAQDALANRVSSDASGKDFGLMDAVVGTGLGATKGMGTAVAAVSGKKLYDKFADPAIASAANAGAKAMHSIGDKIPEFLKSAPEKLGKYAGVLGAAARQGAQAVTIRHFVLSNTDPEYREMLRNLEKEKPEFERQENGLILDKPQ